MKTLILIRGLPGSGKTTLAESLWNYYQGEGNQNCECEMVSADDFFTNSDGVYNFRPSLIGDAHDYCQTRAVRAMQEQTPVVIVHNTFTQLWEMKPYEEAAKAHGYSVQVLHCEGQFENTHKVPNSTIQKMKARWETYPDGKSQSSRDLEAKAQSLLYTD